jgi:hypothetical protein
MPTFSRGVLLCIVQLLGNCLKTLSQNWTHARPIGGRPFNPCVKISRKMREPHSTPRFPIGSG